MMFREDGCSVTKCGQGATCTDIGGEGSCSCDIGYDGNPYTRCYPVNVPQDCPCTRITVSSSAQAADTQSDKMGTYYLYGYHNINNNSDNNNNNKKKKKNNNNNNNNNRNNNGATRTRPTLARRIIKTALSRL